jgi:signal transduction histidine kinase/ligand-binding sensor domain-containing protein
MTRRPAPPAFVFVLTLLLACLSISRVDATGTGPAKGLDDYIVRTWNENDGLFASRITAMEQDGDGYLWLGTDVGLVRFDGVRFVPVTQVGDVSVPASPVPALLSTRDRALWISIIGTNGLVRWHDGEATAFGPAQGLDGGYAMTIVEDHANVMWVGTRAGLFWLDGKRWRPVENVPGLSGRSVIALYETTDGRLWASTREAVFRRDRDAASFVQIDTLDVASNAWQGFSQDAAGVVWISDFTEGFRRVGEHVPHPNRSGWGVQLLHDRRGNFWVATRADGLWRVRGDAVEVLTHKDGLATDAVQCVFEDREGNIWVGTQAGLQRLTPNRVKPVTDVPIARAVVKTRDGSIWIGNAKGLTRFGPGGRRQRHYGKQEGLPGNVVLGLHVDRDDHLWVTTEMGLTSFSNGQFSPLVVASRGDARRIFSMAHVKNEFWLRDNALDLVHTSEDGQRLPLSPIPEDFHQSVSALSSDNEGNLWLGHTEGRVGVLRPDARFERHVLPIGPIRTIRRADDGTVWIGGDEGLTRVRDGKVHSLGAAQGLPNQVKAIVDDGAETLWIGVGSGIARIDTVEIERAFDDPKYRIQYRLFNTADGAAGVPVNDGGSTGMRADDGRLWFATSAGLTVIDPDDIGPPRLTAPAVVEAVTADAQHMELESGLMLPAGVSHVQFLYTALALTDSLRVEFMYRLDGVDRDWVPAGTSRQASYANLGPGQYTFRVKASNGDGVWGEPAVLAFGVHPKFYQTNWFFAAAAFTIFSLVYLVWRLNARRVRTQFALVLAERIRMSRAIHDTLLQGFAGLALQLDDLAHAEMAPAATRERLRGIRRRVEDYIREARQSIWDLRSPVLERRSLPEALREVGARTIADRPVSLDVSVKGAPLPFQPVVEQQLLLICQEALSNAVRHGAPQRVGVELEYGTSQVSVRVSDDGRGFDPHTIEKVTGHYGVISMRERAAQVRGKVTIASQPGKGTCVETVVPVS